MERPALRLDALLHTPLTFLNGSTPTTDKPSPDSPPSPEPPSLTDAIIFIPGLDEGRRETSVQSYARLICHAIQVHEPHYPWHVGSVRTEAFNAECNLSVEACDIQYEHEGKSSSHLTVYKMSYYDLLMKPFRERSLFGKSLILLFVIVPFICRFMKSIFNEGKSKTEKLQIFIAFTLLFILLSYIILVVATAAGIVITSLFPQTTPAVPKPGSLVTEPSFVVEPSSVPTSFWLTGTQLVEQIDPNGLDRSPIGAMIRAQPQMEQTFIDTIWHIGQSMFQRAWHLIASTKWRNILLILTALGVVLPSRQQMRQLIENLGGSLVSLILYLEFGEQRNVLVGQLRDLLMYVARKQNDHPIHRQIHIISYSCGTLLTLDALMPPRVHIANNDDLPGWLTPFHKVSSVTTIGCPFDLIKLYWDKYFTDRYPLPASLKQSDSPGWINIYSPDDVLGSNFRTDNMPGQNAEWGIEIAPTSAPSNKETNDMNEPASVRTILTLTGLQAYLHKARDGTKKDTPGATIEKPGINLAWVTRINPNRSVSALDIITLIGLRAHSLYWEREHDAQINCFDLFVSAVYNRQNPLMGKEKGERRKEKACPIV